MTGNEEQRRSRSENVRKRRRKQAERRTLTRPRTVVVDTWSPATSQPGEIHTPSGRIRAAGSFARGMRNLRRHPMRSEMTGALVFFAVALPVVAFVAWLVDQLLR